MRTSGYSLPVAIMLLAMTGMIAASCVRDEIHDIQENYHVRYDIDYGVQYNALKGDVEMLWLRFYDVNTGKRIYETWAHPDGTDLTIAPGSYHIVAYSYRNDATKFDYENDLNLLTAQTESVRASSGQTVVTAPDHFFFGALKEYDVLYVAVEGPTHEIVIPMKSPLESWRVIVTGVKGLRNSRGITFYLTHQRTDILLGSLEAEGDAVLQFGGRADATLTNVDTPFNTFGMVPGAAYTLQVQMRDAAGMTYVHSVDVTDQINDPANTGHIITFEYDISLLEMVEGGVEPSAKEWDEEYEHHIFN